MTSVSTSTKFTHLEIGGSLFIRKVRTNSMASSAIF